MKFEDLGIIEPIMIALKEKGYENPTPIQEQAIPLVLKEKDMLGCAQTGTGKTAAFAIPIIQLLHKRGTSDGRSKLRSLIVTPTRELAIQIDDNIKSYSKETNLRHTVIFGGVKQFKQVERLKRGVDILVATPGRLLDLIGQGHISLSQIEIFVLDEADRMLDMGFINDIRKLLKMLPAKRQSLFFSATMPDNIVTLSNTILTNPIKIEVTPASRTADTIQQYIYYTNRNLKNELLLHILNDEKMDQTLIFTRTKHGADRVARRLKKEGINSAAIHGDKAQNQRQKALLQFKEGKIKVLVATDIAARGIDINKLKYVINFEIPNQAETYVHRIGRSGRAGEEGVSISICEPEELSDVRDIQKLIGQKIEEVKDNPFPMTDKPMTDAEKKEWNKEKARRKQEFFANRKASRNGGGKKQGDRRSNGNNQSNKSGGKGKPKKRRSENRDDQNNQNQKENSNDSDRNSKPSNNKANGNKKKSNKKNWGRRNTDSPKLKSKMKWPLE
ncbi:MAG: DEAD/DEAH box helicase [Saprospiraceae bacterium]